MRPMLSYGYALTEELAGGTAGDLMAAPVFPSLYAEGQAGGGWDVMIPYPVTPLFLQFKLSHYMVRRTSLATFQIIMTTMSPSTILQPISAPIPAGWTMISAARHIFASLHS